jgi:hypothetical protein
MGIENLILIVPEGRDIVSKNHFPDTILKKNGSGIEWEKIRFRRPDGKIGEVTGAMATHLDLQEVTSEKLYLMVTTFCNVSCKDCGADAQLAKKTKEIDYMEPYFVSTLLPYIKKNIFPDRKNGRQLYVSGGEPTLDLHRLEQIVEILGGVEKRFLAIYTNGILIPIKEGPFKEFADRFKDAIILFNCSTELAEEYRHLYSGEQSSQLNGYLPDCRPENALKEKHRTLLELAQDRIKIHPLLRCSKTDLNQLKNELIEYIGEKYAGLIISQETQILGRSTRGIPPKTDPCSEVEELTITPDGSVFSKCFNYYARTRPIAFIGTHL